MMNKALNHRIRNLFPTPQPLAWRSTALKKGINETHKTGVYQTFGEFPSLAKNKHCVACVI